VGTLNTLIVAADLYNGGVIVAPESVFSGNRVTASNDVAARAMKARALYRWTLAPSEGIGFDGPWTGVIESRIAWLSAVLGEYDEAERVLRRAAARDGMNESYAAAIARVIRGGGNLQGALEFSRAQWEANQQWGNLREELVVWLLEEGRRDEALAIARRGVADAPENTDLQLMAMRRLSLLLVEGKNPVEMEEGLALIDRTLEMAPGNPYAMRARATALRGLDRMSEAEEALRMAISINADEWRFYQDLGELLLATDRIKEGAPLIKQAGEMRMRAQPQ
jgi:tetratricopeptide (TPR) repeat protein